MRPEPARNHSGRLIVLTIVLVSTLAISGMIQLRGWQSGWRFFGVATRDVAWLDLRVITSAAQTAAEGGNPYVANPHDPAGRPLNYPSPWLWFFPGNLTAPAHTAVALGFAAAAFGTLLLGMKAFGWRAGSFVGLLVVSPSLLLAVERGNTDLPIFAVTGLSLLALDSDRRWLALVGVVGLLLASVLKLFPVVTLVIVALAGPALLRRPAQVALALFALWLGLHWSETLATLVNTRAGVGAVHSYGRTVLPFALELYTRAHGQVLDRAPLDLLANVLTAIVLTAAAWLGFKLADRAPFPQALTLEETGFLTGAAIFVFTFVAGASFNYRLWLLLFTLPWLLSKAGSHLPESRWVRLALVCFFVLSWASAVWWVPLVWAAQAAGWLLCAALTVLLARFATSWLTSGRAPKPLGQGQ